MSGPSTDEEFILAPDVIIAPVGSLPSAVRRNIEADDDAFAITRPRARTPSTVVDRQGADLLEEFRGGAPILEAVLAYSEKTGADPRGVLARAFPVLEHLRGAGFLVPVGSPEARRIRPTLSYQDRVDGLEILRALQVVEDTEVYQARAGDGQAVALKIARPDAGPVAGRLLEREAEVLRRIGGARTPMLLSTGSWDGTPYLTMQWIRGVSCGVAAQELRDADAAGRAGLGALCVEIARAYEDLHRSEIVHADVQPGNVLVDRDGDVTLIDFAFARIVDEGAGDALREGRVPYHMSPEDAALRRDRLPALRPTPPGEQYAVATLLYRLIAGDHYLDFALEETSFLRQILGERPLPFSRRGIEPWPEMEAVLGRALSKASTDRYPSTTAFREALERAAAEPTGRRAPRRPRPGPYMERLSRDVFEALRIEGPLFASGPSTAPTGSVTFGRAGIAYALYRYALLRSDPRALAAADAWITRAGQESSAEGAFFNPDFSVTEETVGPASPYHSEAGVHCVQALVSHAMGEVPARDAAILGFVERSAERGGKPDLATGASGTLLASSLLLEALSGTSNGAAAALRTLGNETMTRLWEVLDREEPVEESRTVPDRALAHGWAGLLYATLRWCRASGVPFPNGLPRRMAELAACAEEDGRGVRWRIVDRSGGMEHTRGFGTSWCNGTAGFTYLWTLAARVLGEERYGELAERTAWNVWEGGGDVLNLCCGLGGRAYALLHVYRTSGDRRWLERARRLLERAGRVHARFGGDAGSAFRYSLYKGDVGLALLAAESSRPERACMPFFEEEGWPTGATLR